METLIRPMKLNRSIICPKCGMKNSIELYDNYDRPLDYILHLEHGGFKSLMKDKRLSYFRCKNCHNNFHIDYTNDYPTPLSFNGYNDFQNKFQSVK